MDYPLVTVCTLIYNTNPKYVIEAIQSIKANNYPNLQHIIIDDCSTDPQPKEIVKKWILENNYQCEFYEHEVNYGICKTLNHVLELTRGKYFLGCSDDIITSDRILQDVIQFSKLTDDYSIVFGLTQEINENGVLKPKVFPWTEEPSSDNYWDLLLKGNCLSGPSTTYKTEILKDINGFNENFKLEDYEMNLRLASNKYKFKAIAKINGFYRVHSNSISSKLNFELENIRVLSNFKNEEKIKDIIYERVWQFLFHRKDGYKEALQIYVTSFGNNWKLGLTKTIKNKLLLRFINKIIKLSSI
jgi:glycosyltransferase involved in cell wall biosynthesis